MADYDGDVVSLRGLWSDEANNEANQIMNQKSSALNINGSNARVVEMEVVNAFYELTRMGTPVKTVPVALAQKYLKMRPDDFTRTVIVEMLADTTDSSKGNEIKRKLALHRAWDTFTVPAKYFYPKQEILKTTIGRFLLNKYVLEGAGIIAHTLAVNAEVNSNVLKGLDQVVGKLLLNDIITRKQFNDYINRRDNLGYWLNGMLAHTVSLKMAKPLKEITAEKQRLYNLHKAEIEAGNLEVMAQIEKELLAYAQKLLGDDPGMNLYKSGDLSFDNAYKNNAIVRGPVYNSLTNDYNFVPNAYLDGLRVEDIPAQANAVVTASYSGAIKTADSGYLGKKLIALLQLAVIDAPGTDCRAKNLIPIKVTEINKSDLVYSYFRNGSKLELLTDANVSRYVGRTLEFRSPASCLNPRYCSVCAGQLLYKLGITQVGLGSVAVSHSLLNLNLKLKHSLNVKMTTLDPKNIIESIK